MNEYKYYYTYKVTCTEGSFKDKVYYGQHKTNDLNDGYKGSGTKLKDYYKKYPNSYSIEIIQFYSNLDELNNAEYELIETHLGKDYCLNLRDGGNQGTMSDETKQKISQSKIGKYSGEGNPFYGKHHTDESLNKISESTKIAMTSQEIRDKISKAHKGKQSGFKGKCHSEETKQILSDLVSNYWNENPDKLIENGRKISQKRKGKPSNTKGKHYIIDENKKRHYYNINPLTNEKEFYT